MTKNRLRTLIKQAKSAKDKAMETAALLGKPTSTGIAAGAGLGAILAAAGALHRSGEDPSNTSVLSNPLLLGALGATGGYLAGNAFEKAPVHRAKKNLSTLALAGLLGGGGTLGSLLAKQDAFDVLNDVVERDAKGNITKHLAEGARTKFLNAINPAKNLGIRVHMDDGGIHYWLPNNGKGKGAQLSGSELKELENLSKLQENYATALKRTGQYEKAMRHAGFKPSEYMLGRLWDRIKHHPFSPVSWTRGAINTARRGTFIKAFTHPKARTAAGIAGLALLAGGGKALYDKLSD